jgi:hypothetical protein
MQTDMIEVCDRINSVSLTTLSPKRKIDFSNKESQGQAGCLPHKSFWRELIDLIRGLGFVPQPNLRIKSKKPGLCCYHFPFYYLHIPTTKPTSKTQKQQRVKVIFIQLNYRYYSSWLHINYSTSSRQLPITNHQLSRLNFLQSLQIINCRF